jgi:transmembrane sensor
MSADYQDDLRRARVASEWLVRLESDGPACHAAFTEWMMSSPQHVREFLAVSKMSRRLERVDPERAIDVETLARQWTSQVIPLRRDTEDSPHLSKQVRRSKWAVATGLAALVLLCVLTAVRVTSDRAAKTFATTLGEQRSFKLDDGSVVHLNAQSRIDVRFSRNARDIQLIQGEALFDVQHETQRPFRVSAGPVNVRALGTQFDVNRREEGTIVSVMEGRVGVSLADRQHMPVAILGRGEQMSIEHAGSIQKRSVPDVQQPVAWRQRRLVFQDVPLADVAAEFNRYNVPGFEVHGADVRNKHISGVFSADHPEALVLYLERDESLRVERRDGAVIVQPR